MGSELVQAERFADTLHFPGQSPGPREEMAEWSRQGCELCRDVQHWLIVLVECEGP